ncbi:shikimate dehydrogenase family protein [Aspergillus clavatus NRRL 1]|uniref:Quinate 5-dehydrogenase QutB, putative n=1 Tax=Aspergillus clavatus (strain ATCC 1007 / CBS 513.65 / DSM 816 / NCTC 3887 / NRRL 1 / QM 1276 / 107) TaxID=344612 RepID=A1CPW9_ASPCL|nr:quinate 5-dehydrogenase QutB, putative [Aspergillus clavatus NRRL 1]EAW07690.1 quinate 5-dehydrogenase QutB, putative [Aspergillus clavatus NRRL 1]
MAAAQPTNAMKHEQQPLEEPIHCPDHLDGVAYLYGHPLLNSLSPPLHHIVYTTLGLNWAQIPLSSVHGTSETYPPPYTRSPAIPKYLASIRSNPKFVGSSVTMPWKVSIMPHLDDLTEDARQAGACNTVFLRPEADGSRSYVGTNTDCIGIREALLQNSAGEASFRNKPALIVGGGGTARTAIYVMRKWLGASKIYIVNRDAAEVAAILEEDAQRNPNPDKAPLVHVADPAVAAALEAPAAIVSGIPNYPPKTPEEIQAREVLRAFLGEAPAASAESFTGVILEMCYHPVPWTEIAQLASTAGWKVILGSEALIWQGLEQARLWTGKDVVAEPGLVEKVKEEVARLIAERVPSKSHL